MSLKLAISTAVGVAVALAGPAVAHHSFAMFDRSREVQVTGAVKSWQFTNPHGYLQVVARYGLGPAKELSLETTGVSGLLRKGFRRDTYAADDQVTVILHPLRSGAPGGELVEVKSADGKVRTFYDGQRFAPEVIK